MGEEMNALVQVWKHIYAFADSMVLKCAIQLKIADTIHKHGEPMTVSELGAAIPAACQDMDWFHRIVRYLVHMKLLALVEKGQEKRYALTPASKLLVRDKEKTLAQYALLQLHSNEMDPWQYLVSGLDGKVTPWIACHSVPYYEKVGKDPKLKQLHNVAMNNHSSFVVAAVLEVFKRKGVLEGLHTLVDVGGGTGIAAKAIANTFAHVKCTVMDLPYVIESIRDDPKIDFIAGDVFVHVPNADVIFLKSLLHGYNDEDCIKILKKCKEAVAGSKGGKVIVVEVVVDTEEFQEFTAARLCMDLEMMIFGGKERTKEEWNNLMEISGFTHYSIIPISAAESIIEAHP